jgi:hypothetical protein
MNKVLGIILIVVGIIGIGWGAFTFTTQKKVVDVGPIHATRSEHHTVPIPPIAGVILLAGGVYLVARP